MVITSAIRNEVFTGNTNVINWDGYGYYVYLPAIFIYGDVEDYAFVDQHFTQYEVSSEVYQIMEAEDGSKFPIYNIGLAVLWAPAFLATHALVTVTGIAAADGMSYPYQLTVVLMSWLVFFLGLRYLRRLLLLDFPEITVAFTLLGIGLGTNLFYYAVEKPDMTHAYLFAGYALLMWRFRKTLEKESGGFSTGTMFHWANFGLLAGLLCLVRSSEIVLFILPALFGLRNPTALLRNFRRTLPAFLVALAIFALFQLTFYKVSTGQWFRDGYAGLGFDWTAPHLYEGFFSYRRGWLVYTPLMALSLMGIFFLRRVWVLPVLVFTIANCYLLFSWHIWWYGNTFGSRPVVQSYAVLALPLAALLARLFSLARPLNLSDNLAAFHGPGKGFSKIIPGGILLVFITLNLFQHWQYNQRIIPLDFTNRTYYWHVFGKTTLDKKDRVYLDTDEKLPATAVPVNPLIAADTLLAIPPKTAREFTNLLEASPEETRSTPWLRSQVLFSYHGDSYDKWKFPAVVTEHKRGEETLKWVQVKIPPTLTNPARDSLTFSISLPGYQQGDVVKQYLWNLSQDSMAIYRFRAEIFNEGR